MNRPILVCTLFVAAAMAVGAQEASQSSAYQGTSNPPPDDLIITNSVPIPAAKPPAGHPMTSQPMNSQPIAPTQPQLQQRANAPDSSMNDQGAGNDDGIVQVPPTQQYQPVLQQRAQISDPDGDIVHPRPLGPGELGEGTIIRVRLLDGLSTTENEIGQPFRTQVASDVFSGNQVVIPAGAEIDGRIAQISSGHAGGHGSMRLLPETVILPDGSRYRLYAVVTATPGSRTHVGSEGTILPDSRFKRDSIEYGGVAGAGAMTGAILGGPVGALAGTIVGAGVVTTHLLVSHPQARLDEGTVLDFMLTEPLNMVPAGAGGS